MKVGDLVECAGQDSYFRGYVVALFNKLDDRGEPNGPERCVVQDNRKLLLIKNPEAGKVIRSCCGTAGSGPDGVRE